MTEAASDNNRPSINPNIIESFHLTGKGPHWNFSNDVLRATMRESMLLFHKSEDRLPDDRETLLLWAAVQRWHGVPEQSLMPEEMRRQ